MLTIIRRCLTCVLKFAILHGNSQWKAMGFLIFPFWVMDECKNHKPITHTGNFPTTMIVHQYDAHLDPWILMLSNQDHTCFLVRRTKPVSFTIETRISWKLKSLRHVNSIFSQTLNLNLSVGGGGGVLAWIHSKSWP